MPCSTENDERHTATLREFSWRRAFRELSVDVFGFGVAATQNRTSHENCCTATLNKIFDHLFTRPPDAPRVTVRAPEPSGATAQQKDPKPLVTSCFAVYRPAAGARRVITPSRDAESAAKNLDKS